VFQSEQKLRHLPFFEEVASHDEGDAAWRSATAGLVVLRLVDAWLENGRSVVADDGWSVRSVRAAIESMDDGTPIKSILDRVVDALHEQKPDIHVVVTPLMAYAKALEYDAQWRLAVDVYQSVLAHLHPREDSDASVAAHIRLGHCFRNLGQLEEATSAFVEASGVANGVGDIVGTLRARIGEGIVAMLKGNLPRAQTILDEAIDRSTSADLLDVRSRALHVRANVEQLRGNYELAIRMAYEAMEQAESATERDRILNDIAVSFFELGVYSAARDAYLVLSVSAQEEYVRWAAHLNLLDVTSQTGSEVQFEAIRREMSKVKNLPPYLAAGFQLNLGTGYARLGAPGKSRHHLEQALLLAQEHGHNQFVFEAEQALKSLETTSPPRRPQREIPLDVEEVANAIRELREAAGVSS